MLFKVEARVIFEDAYFLRLNSVRMKQSVLLHLNPE